MLSENQKIADHNLQYDQNFHDINWWNNAIFIVLGEITLPFLLWCLVKRRTVILLQTHAIFRPFKTPLKLLGAKLVQKGTVLHVDCVFPKLARGKASLGHNRLGMYVDSEPWLMEEFAFKTLTKLVRPEYVRPVKHEISKYVFSFNPLAYTLSVLGNLAPEGKFTVVGLPSVAEDLYRVIFGMGSYLSTWRPSQGLIINYAMALIFVLFGISEFMRRSRIYFKPKKEYALGVDWVWGGGEPRHNRIALELSDPGDRVLVVRRSRNDNYDGSMDTHRVVVFGEEKTGVKKSLSYCMFLISGIWEMTRAFNHLNSSIFWILAALPIRHARWKRFLDLYPCQKFWGRDDYNVDHYFRTAELRARGGLSIGIAHGIMGWGHFDPQIRYTDYDLYFVFGMGIYDRYYTKYLSSIMRIIAVGSFGMSRKQLLELSAPRPPDILLFLDPVIDEPQKLAFGLEIARAFPDRKLLIKFKVDRERAVYYADMMTMIENGSPPNVRQTKEDSYKLILQASYALSGPSTIAAECVQFGLATWMLDLDPSFKYVHYRNFPGFCVTEPEQVINRIKGIESGKLSYPRSSFSEMIDLSGEIIYDVIRREVGLKELQPGNRRPMI